MPQVRELMTSAPTTIGPTASVIDAANLMIQAERGPLPVVEGERAVGMITDRDIIARVVAENRDPSTTTVNDVATKELITVAPDEDVEQAVALMSQYRIDRILVTEGDRLVGIISEADVHGG